MIVERDIKHDLHSILKQQKNWKAPPEHQQTTRLVVLLEKS